MYWKWEATQCGDAKNMKITIGISAYNQQEFLPDAIESALNQSVDCEVIVVNDGSPDNTKEIAEGYEVKVINQANKGLASARNTVIMNMTGDYFLPLDSDDQLLENCVEKIIEVAEETKADIISPSFRCFGTESGNVILGSNPSLEDFKTANRIGYCSAIRTKTLKDVGGYNPKMVYGWEDWDLWIDLLKRGAKLVTIPEVLWLYRTKTTSMYKDSLKHSEFLTNQMRLNHPKVYEK